MSETGEITARDSLARLTQLSKEIEALYLASDEDDPNKEALSNAIEQIGAQWLDKVESIGLLIKDYEHMISDFKAEANRLDNFSKNLELRMEWLKQYLMFNMESKKDTNLKFPMVTVQIANNPPSVGITDEKAIPPKYVRIVQETKINRVEILKDLKEGKEVPGCFLVTGKKSLRIK